MMEEAAFQFGRAIGLFIGQMWWLILIGIAIFLALRHLERAPGSSWQGWRVLLGLGGAVVVIQFCGTLDNEYSSAPAREAVGAPTTEPAHSLPEPTWEIADGLRVEAFAGPRTWSGRQVLGVIHNETGEQIHLPHIKAHYFADGVIVKEHTATGALGTPLEPGEWTPFSVDIASEDWDAWRISVQPGTSSFYAPAPGLEIVSDELTATGALRVVLRNDSRGQLRRLWGVAAAYDADNRLVAVGWAFPATREIGPGESTLLELSGRNWRGNIDAASYYAIAVRAERD